MKTEKNLQKAVQILKKGGLVAIPTETVYGLAADASNPDAVAKIFKAKGRPSDHPLIVHVADSSMILEWAIDVPPQAMLLANHFWPGPLTLILKKAASVSPAITGGQDSIGIRIPRHPLTLDLLKLFNGGVAAPSANRFGRISPTTADAVKEELGDKVDLILDGGQCEIGVESTIIDARTETLQILRPGMITACEIEAVLNKPLVSLNQNNLKVSGSLESHYAPLTHTAFLSTVELKQMLSVIEKKNIRVAILLRKNSSLISLAQKIPSVSLVVMPEETHEYAHDLYQQLREVDKKNFQHIFIEEVPDVSSWDAIRDRLKKASGHSSGSSNLSQLE